MELLNIGCGDKFHERWINIDFKPSDRAVKKCDVLKGLPYHDDEFDAIYFAHLLEHLTSKEAQSFIEECFRVLKPGGIIRVVVPDLEEIVNVYISSLLGAINNDPKAIETYEWIKLELYDQAVREHSGGEMISFLQKEQVLDNKFIVDRVGKELIKIREEGRKLKKIQSMFDIRQWKEIIQRLVLGAEYKILQVGQFRKSGEIHLIMYDRYSLRVLLEKNSFISINQVDALTSQIPDWGEYYLDADVNGEAYRPGSLYMEAIKP